MIMISANVEMNKTIFNWNTHQVISRPTVHSLDQPCMLCSGRRQKQVAEGVDQMGHMWCQICNQNFKVLTLCGCGRLDHPGDFNLDANSCTVFFPGCVNKFELLVVPPAMATEPAEAKQSKRKFRWAERRCRPEVIEKILVQLA